jgi:hypothetical protein
MCRAASIQFEFIKIAALAVVANPLRRRQLLKRIASKVIPPLSVPHFGFPYFLLLVLLKTVHLRHLSDGNV